MAGNDDLLVLWTNLTKRLNEWLEQSPELRTEIRRLFVRIMEEPKPAAEPPAPAIVEIAAVPEASPLVEPAKMPVATIPIGVTISPASMGEAALLSQELRLGAAPPSPRIELPERWKRYAEADLPMFEKRCRLKGDAAGWAAERNRFLPEKADLTPDLKTQLDALIAEARNVPDCYLWMCSKTAAAANAWKWDTVAGCFRATAEALQMTHAILPDPESSDELVEATLYLLAEAQSALRGAIREVGGPIDNDQIRIFKWLEQTAKENRIWIGNYMRSDDAADPNRYEDLAARVRQLGERGEEARKKDKKRSNLLRSIRHKASRLAGAAGDSPTEPELEIWRELMSAVDELVRLDVPPSNKDLRDAIQPLMNRFPIDEEVPEGFQRVVLEIDRFLATAPTAIEIEDEGPPNELVRAAAALLNGRTAALIGGHCIPRARDNLIAAFQLDDLIWPTMKENHSVFDYEPTIRRSDVDVILLAIRFIRHGDNQIRDFCDRYGKILVRLPAGYSVNQVAVQVVEQASQRLAREPAA